MVDRIVKASILAVFRARTRPEKLPDVVAAFEDGLVVHTGDDIASSDYAKLLTRRARAPVHRSPTSRSARPRPGVASATEFVLEGLHLSKRLNKDAMGGRAAYRGRG